MRPRHVLYSIVSVLLPALAGADILERIIARVNGDIVTLSEFEARQLGAVQAARIGPGEVERFLRENNTRILNEAVDELLLVQRASELGLDVPDSYLDQVINDIKKENGITSDEALVAQLHREGMSLGDLRRNVKRSIMRRQALARDLEPRVTISPADARRFYEENRDEYESPAAVHLSEILVEGEGASERAQSLAARARQGEDFAALAREHSAAATAPGGGDLGRIRRGELAEQLDRVAFGLEGGAVSEPLPAAAGAYRILKLNEKFAAATTPFETVRPAIEEQLRQERWRQEYDRYIQGLRDAAAGGIQMLVREVPLQVALPDAATLGLGTSDGSPAASPGAAPDAPRPGPIAPDEPEFSTSPQERPEQVRPGDGARKPVEEEQTPPLGP